MTCPQDEIHLLLPQIVHRPRLMKTGCNLPLPHVGNFTGNIDLVTCDSCCLHYRSLAEAARNGDIDWKQFDESEALNHQQSLERISHE